MSDPAPDPEDVPIEAEVGAPPVHDDELFETSSGTGIPVVPAHEPSPEATGPTQVPLPSWDDSVPDEWDLSEDETLPAIDLTRTGAALDPYSVPDATVDISQARAHESPLRPLATQSGPLVLKDPDWKPDELEAPGVVDPALAIESVGRDDFPEPEEEEPGIRFLPDSSMTFEEDEDAQATETTAAISFVSLKGEKANDLPPDPLRPLVEQVEEKTGRKVDLCLDDEPLEERKSPFPLPPRYRWLARLGEGGQGSVELVHDHDLGRAVALKTLHVHKQDDGRLVDLFREARITGQLEHPQIITIYDAGVLPDGRLYYTMRRMPGDSLHNVLSLLRRGHAEAERRWGRIALIQVLEKACHGVGYAHARGVIHRDLKPANILLGGHGEVLVVDWGIARVLGHDLDTPSMRRLWSEAGEPRKERVRGSPPYMAPEQVQHPDQVTPAADVFCLGVILYQALCGHSPFLGASVDETVEALCHEKPVPPRDRAPDRNIPAELEEVCLRALEKFPGHRFPTASAMAEALTGFLSGHGRRATASRRLRDARSMGTRYRVIAEQAKEERSKILQIAGPIGTATLLQRSEKLRSARDQLASLERASDGLFSEAVWALHRALHLDPESREIREELAKLYGERYAEAERLGATREAALYRAMLRQFDDGRWGRWLRTGAELAVEVLPNATPLLLCRLEDRGGSLIPGEVLHSDGPNRWYVAPGRYALVPDTGLDSLESGWHYPVRLGRDEVARITLDLKGADEAGELFCFIPGGRLLRGGDPLAAGSGAEEAMEIGPFALARHPVTVGAYGRFLDAVKATDPNQASLHRPLGFDALKEAGDKRPVTGVTLKDAEAYCAWLCEATGIRLRLPTADEWEKAARAADGRSYPWGESFGPGRCASLALGIPAGPAPEVGSHPNDRSPFGVEDMAGGVWEWTSTPASTRRQLVVGGSLVSEANGCRSAARRAIDTKAYMPFLGFRVLREVG